MARILSILSLLLVLVVVFTCVIFALRNDGLVTVDFLIIEFSSISLGMWLLTTLVIGLVLGFLFSIPAQLLLTGSKKLKDKQLQATEVKLSRLKRASAKG